MKTWKEIDQLGNEYYSETYRGHGIPKRKGKGYDWSNDPRSKKQIELSKEIVNKTLPYIQQTASHLLTGYEKMPHGEITLKDCKRVYQYDKSEGLMSLDDLTQIGVLAVIQTLHTYRPNIAMSTFIRQTVAGTIYREVQRKISPIQNDNKPIEVMSIQDKKFDDRTLEDILPDEKLPSVEASHDYTELLDIVQTLLPQEQEVIEERLGIREKIDISPINRCRRYKKGIEKLQAFYQV